MALYSSYGSYGARFGLFNEASICIEVAQTVRQRPLFLSGTMTLVNGAVPTAEQKAGYARVLVYVGAATFNLNDLTNIQAYRSDWGVLGAERILLNHVFPINNGFSLVLPTLDAPLYRSQENQTLGALLVCPCDQVGVVMEGYGTLTFLGTPEDDSDAPTYKVK